MKNTNNSSCILQPILVERVFSSLNHRTFQIPAVKELLEQEITGTGKIIDPFPFQSKVDVFDYLNTIPNNSVDYALVDPPYTKRQVSEHYKEQGVKVTGWHTSSGWTWKVKSEIAKKLKLGGKAIVFGYNSSGLGRCNGFEIIRVRYINHGLDHYDLACTVCVKTSNKQKGESV